MVERKPESIRLSGRAAVIAAVASTVPLGLGCRHGPAPPSGAAPADAGGGSPSIDGAANDASTGGPGAAFSIARSGTTYVATSTADPRFAVEVDCDDETADGRFFGVSPVIDGKRLEIAMYGGPKFPLFTPDFDAGEIRCIRVESDEKKLGVRLEAGSYRALDAAGPDEGVPLEAAFSLEAGHLVARLSGIYYMMLTRANTSLQIAHGDVATRTITDGSAAFTETFDDVTSIAVDDSIYGQLAIEAVIARLQVQLYDDGSQGFELDLDHAFKDRGQKSVMSTVSFP